MYSPNILPTFFAMKQTFNIVSVHRLNFNEKTCHYKHVVITCCPPDF